MDEAQASSRLQEISGLPLDERAEHLERLLDDLEAALEETSPSDPDSQS